MSSQRIVVVGIGYVGLSLAVLLSQKNEVVAIDLDESKVDKVNNRVSPIEDVQISEFFADKVLNLSATRRTRFPPSPRPTSSSSRRQRTTIQRATPLTRRA